MDKVLHEENILKSQLEHIGASVKSRRDKDGFWENVCIVEYIPGGDNSKKGNPGNTAQEEKKNPKFHNINFEFQKDLLLHPLTVII